ncbi:type II secretion system protein [Lysobacter xinjiangensis]|uniref:Type II secretion system protein n=1 Tax=Cognatilysobacter xinjiangensis TaxID=546892 RepID=A0ABQ3C746_9GAMM|nr:type II secretion system protein [Lysobacter xinjiangensis]
MSGVNAGAAMPPVKGGPINVNIEAMPVPAFINEFFGTVLGVTFQMDPAVAKLNDLVTLRTSGPQKPEDFYRLATQVLKAYGVSTVYENGRVYFRRAGKGDDFEPPLVLSGRALPEVPISHRPIFQLVELQAVRTGDVTQWLSTAFKTDALNIKDDPSRNAIVLYGKPEIVRQAVAAIRVLDRPFMRGRVSTRLEPAFVSADELGRRLVDVLAAEGFGAMLHTGQAMPQSAAIVVLPVAAANTVLIFASDRDVLEHAVDWARTIDKPNPAAGSDSLFYYMVQNTRAEEIAATINAMRGDAGSGSNAVASATPSVAGTAAAPAAPPVSVSVGGASRLVVDAPRNALIFQGSATDWSRVQPLIKQMDRAPRQVMIEVTIAEVTLGKDENFGVSWLARSNPGRFNGTITSGRIGGGSGNGGGEGSGLSGLTYLLDVAGQARVQLTAAAQDSRLNILSTPRLMVKSGAEASIDVGTEIPTITSQSTSPQQTDGTSNLLQTVQYRKTGIILNIKPIVYSDDRIDLEIRQEVSEALPLEAGGVASPSIFNRSFSSSLSLRDGSSILIGGLMSTRSSNSDGGVPYLKDIPILGNAFKTRSRENTKTELVLMIVPYVVESDDQARALTSSLGDRLELVELPAVAPIAPTPSPTPAVPLR